MHGLLARLPRELRDQIYYQLIAEENTVICFTIDADSSPDGQNDTICHAESDSGLPATSKVLRAESLEACKRSALHHVKIRLRLGSRCTCGRLSSLILPSICRERCVLIVELQPTQLKDMPGRTLSLTAVRHAFQAISAMIGANCQTIVELALFVDVVDFDLQSVDRDCAVYHEARSIFWPLFMLCRHCVSVQSCCPSTLTDRCGQEREEMELTPKVRLPQLDGCVASGYIWI